MNTFISKRRIVFLLVTAVLWSSCLKPKSAVEDLSFQVKYASKIENLTGQVGVERVFLQWDNPNDKAVKKIRIEYGENQAIDIDEMVSSYTVEGLTSPVGYNFTIYTIDQYGNKSIGTSIFLMPVTSAFINEAQPFQPNYYAIGNRVFIRWANLNYHSQLSYAQDITYSYTINGVKYTGYATSDSKNEQTIVLPSMVIPANFELSYSMKYIPILNSKLTSDTILISKTSPVRITESRPETPVMVNRADLKRYIGIPFDNTTDYGYGYSFAGLFDGKLEEPDIWISSQLNQDPVNGGNGQNNYKLPFSFTIDMTTSKILTDIELTYFFNYAQAPKRFEVWGTNSIASGKPNSYWGTTIPGAWQNDWVKLGDCYINPITKRINKFPINADRNSVRYIRVVIKEFQNPLPDQIRIVLCELSLYHLSLQ